MKIQAKYVCAIIGLIITRSFFGALIGFFIGVLLDEGLFRHFFKNFKGQFSGQTQNSHSVQSVFFITTFQIMGYLAKVDGRVSAREIKIAESVMDRMNLNTAQRQQAIDYFNQGKQDGFAWQASLKDLRMRCWMQPTVLKAFVDIQAEIAQADGGNPATRQALENICQALGLGPMNFGYQGGYGGQRSNGYSQSGGYRAASQAYSLDQAYALLGVSSSATQPEVKKAYRLLMSRNHPDKLIAKGVPEAMVKIATEKTQKIQKAYEEICKARGW